MRHSPQPLLARATVTVWLVSAAGMPLRADVPVPRDDACQQAMRAYQAAPADLQAERRFRLACYPAPGRAPVLREPITVDGTLAPAIPFPMAPAAPPAVGQPGGPRVLTQCDGGGCWDSQGTRYNGTGTILMGPGGTPCTVSGDRIECR